MSWGQYQPGPSEPHPDPYGRIPTSTEPGGYVGHDPYAPPGYHYGAAHPPRPAVGFLDAIKLFFRNYAVFHGRASRSEYWWMYLAWFLTSILLVIPIVGVVAVVGTDSPEPPIALIVYALVLMVLSLGLVVPTISLQVRRLHDAGFSGFFSIFAYVPYLNYITFLVPMIMSAMPSKPEGVKYDNPDGSQPAIV